jgi:chitosanase
MINQEQKFAIDAIISIFETGKVPSAKSYSTCTILADGAGISYGKHQCTDKAGSLDRVVRTYIRMQGEYANDLAKYLPLLENNASTKVPPKGPWGTEVTQLVEKLRLAGNDPIMWRAQDEVFDEDYFMPALQHARDAGLTTALGLLAIYDTCIHSGPSRVLTHRKAFPELSPKNGGDEHKWIIAYLNARKQWLLSRSNSLVRKTIYRQDAMLELAASNNWQLALPLKVRGVKVSL